MGGGCGGKQERLTEPDKTNHRRNTFKDSYHVKPRVVVNEAQLDFAAVDRNFKEDHGPGPDPDSD